MPDALFSPIIFHTFLRSPSDSITFSVVRLQSCCICSKNGAQRPNASTTIAIFATIIYLSLVTTRTTSSQPASNRPHSYATEFIKNIYTRGHSNLTIIALLGSLDHPNSTTATDKGVLTIANTTHVKPFLSS